MSLILSDLAILCRLGLQNFKNMLPLLGIEPGPLITFVQHSPFSATWEFACKTETLGSLYTNALLILTESSKSKYQVVHEQKFKDLLSSTCQISSERGALDLESKVVRGLGSIPTGGNICLSFYNTNLHKIARSDRIGFTTKNSIRLSASKHDQKFSHIYNIYLYGLVACTIVYLRERAEG